jgi:hypothetical protein
VELNDNLLTFDAPVLNFVGGYFAVSSAARADAWRTSPHTSTPYTAYAARGAHVPPARHASPRYPSPRSQLAANHAACHTWQVLSNNVLANISVPKVVEVGNEFSQTYSTPITTPDGTVLQYLSIVVIACSLPARMRLLFARTHACDQ